MPHDGLRINLFGRANLIFKGQPFEFHGPDRSLALLAYLLVHRDRELTRDGVAFTLWPDLPESAARARLRKCLHLLIVGLPRYEGTPWILSNKRFIRWNPAADARTDLEEFAQFGADPKTCGMAVALYRGDLLSGLDEEWLLGPRTDFRERFQAMLAASIEAARAAGDHAATCLYARRALEIDPWREDALRALMSALHESGDRTGAIRLYREFVENVRTEMGIEPAPATVQLFEKLGARPMASVAPARSDNLPANITAFVGREREIETLREAIAECRLVTLTGVGGIGKSRLALEAARSLIGTLPDGVWLVELASVQDPATVAARIGFVVDVLERPGETMLDTLLNALRSQTLILLLDNCEHLIDGVAGTVERLLQGCPNLRIVATSREPLRILGERIEPVGPLPTPPDTDEIPTLSQLSTIPATRLFLIRAADRDKTLRTAQLDAEGRHALAGIVRRLDGIPLAIELAASCTDLLTLPELEANLDRRLELLTGGSRTAPARHQTLRATLDWSYGMLSETEQRVFERLGVFRGGWSLGAAISVCSDSVIGGIDVQRAIIGLLGKSLVFSSKRGSDRGYNMLETMRLYSLERLELRGEIDAIRLRHLNWCIAAAEEANGPWIRPEAARSTRLLRPELDNVLQALHWGFANQSQRSGIRLTHAARTALSVISLNELSRWAKLAMDAMPAGSDPEIETDLLWDLSAIRYSEIGDDADRLRSWEKCLESYRSLPDRRREAYALARLVEIYHPLRRHQEAIRASEMSVTIAHETGDVAILGYALVAKAIALPPTDIKTRRVLISQAIEKLQGSDQIAHCGRAYMLLAELEYECGNGHGAIENASRAIAVFEAHELPHFAQEPRTNIPMYLNAVGHFAEALQSACNLLPAQRTYGQSTSTVWTLLHIAAAVAHLHDTEDSGRLLGYFRFTLNKRNVAIWPTDAREAEELAEFLKGQLDPETLASLYREGEAMSDSEAVALALSLPARCLPAAAEPELQPTIAG